MHPRVWKGMEDTLVIPIIIIYQKSIESSELSIHWKEAVISSVFSKEAKEATQGTTVR